MLRITFTQVSYKPGILIGKIGFSYIPSTHWDGKTMSAVRLDREAFCMCEVGKNYTQLTPIAGEAHLPFCLGDKKIYEDTRDLVNAYFSAKEGTDAYMWA